jgi:hypothetical protein
LLLGGVYLNIAIAGALYYPLPITGESTTVIPIVENIEECNVTTSQFKSELNCYQDGTEHSGFELQENCILTATLQNDQNTRSSQVIPPEEPTCSLQTRRNHCTRTICGNFLHIQYALYGLLYNFGYIGFTIYVPIQATTLEIGDYQRALLVSVPGGMDILGRLVVGVISNTSLIQRYKLLVLTGVVTGINAFIFPSADTFWWMLLHSSVHGLIGGSLTAIFAVVLADIVGQERVSHGLGWIMSALSLSSSISPPLLGMCHYNISTISVLFISCQMG